MNRDFLVKIQRNGALKQIGIAKVDDLTERINIMITDPSLVDLMLDEDKKASALIVFERA